MIWIAILYLYAGLLMAEAGRGGVDKLWYGLILFGWPVVMLAMILLKRRNDRAQASKRKPEDRHPR